LEIVLEKTGGLEVCFLSYNEALSDVGSHFQRDLDLELKRIQMNCTGHFILVKRSVIEVLKMDPELTL
jgi:hypothetical protein